MNFQALVFDLDGTAIISKPDALPSQAVIDAVNQAKKHCHVSVATGRPYELCKEILDALDINDLCILNGGTHLYSRKTNEYVWKQEIDSITLQKLFTQLKPFSQYEVSNEKKLLRVPMEKHIIDEPVGLTCIFSTSKQDAEKIVSIVQKFPNITAHAVASWKEGTFDIHITHELATKKHALQSLLSRLNVKMSEVMVVGDGGNDLPLFELAGWKVAMGNAAKTLKEKADWVAPTVDEDGLAIAIKKFILNNV